MGIYVFTARTMFELLCQDATRTDSDHDFGKNIIPPILNTQRVFAYRFRDQNRKEVPYWRDVGTLDAYYQANMDLINVDPVLNLYDREWPIRTYQPQLPPPKFVFNDGPGDNARRGEAHDSMVCQGAIISGGHVRRSILSPNVRVNSLRRRRIVDPVRRRQRRPALPHSPCHHRQGRADPGRHHHRAQPGARSAARLHDQRARRRRHRQVGTARNLCRTLNAFVSYAMPTALLVLVRAVGLVFSSCLPSWASRQRSYLSFST